MDTIFSKEEIVISELKNEDTRKKISPDYKVGGVWALLGKKDNNDSWEFLQFAQTKNIYKEVNENIKLCNHNFRAEMQMKQCVNQFGESMFSYDKCFSYKHYLYAEISKKYEELKFVLVAKSEDVNKQEYIEKYFTWKTRHYIGEMVEYTKKKKTTVKKILMS